MKPVVTISNRSRKKNPRLVFAQSVILFVLCLVSVVLGINTIAATNAANQSTPVKTFTVSLDSKDSWYNSDDFYNMYSVEQGGTLDLPIPIRFNSTFAGWYRNMAYKDGTVFNTQTDLVQQDIRLYARFIKNSYTITLVDPRLYLNLDGTVNKDYKPQTFTEKTGTEFTFPRVPEIPDGTEIPYNVPKESFGAFKGWSNTMLYKQASGETSIIAQPDETFENCFRQNVTYWAAFENWKIPLSIDSDFEVSVRPWIDYPIVKEELENPSIPFVTLYYDKNNDPIPQPANLPFILPNMPFIRLNDGLTAYSFAGWILSPDYVVGQRIYLDGEAIIPEKLVQNSSSGENILEFYSLWKTN